MTHLYMIRHGQAVTNVEPILGGMKGCRGLTPFGRLQAERLRDRLAQTGEIQADVLIASTMPRATETAQIIAPALKLPIIYDDEVHELRPGDADGMTFEEARAKYGRPNFLKEPLKPVFPGGESVGDFTLRVGRAIDRITREHYGKTIVIVCHGGVIDNTFVYFTGMSTLQLPPIEFHTRNTSITYWRLNQRDPDYPPRWRLVSYNDTIHLRDINTGKLIQWEDVAPQPVLGEDHPSVPIPTEDSQGEES